jgi:hypothetical protein
VYWAHDIQFWDGTIPFSSYAAHTSVTATLPALAPH